MHLGEIIKKNLEAYMHLRGLNQVQVAERANLKQPVVSRALSGLMENVETKTLIALAKGVDCHPWELIKSEDAIPTPAPQSPTLEALTKVIQDQEETIQKLRKELEEKQKSSPSVSLVENVPVSANSDFDVIVNLLRNANPRQIQRIREIVEIRLGAKKASLDQSKSRLPRKG